MERPSEYTTPQVAKILEIPQRKILSYIERRYITASIQDADGHGSRRLWALWDLDKTHLIRKCENLGVSVRGLRILSSTLVPPFWPNILLKVKECPYLVMNEHGDMAHYEYSLEKQIRTMGGPSVVIPLKDIVAEVEEMLEKAGYGWKE